MPLTKPNPLPHICRFGFLALRVGVTRLIRLLCAGIVALFMWLVSQLDYARDLRARPPATA